MTIRNPLSLRLFRCLVGCVSLMVMLSSTTPVLGNKPIPITDRLIESTIGTGTDELRFRIPFHSNGENIRVAIIDTGLAMDHPAFHDPTIRIVDQYNFLNNTPYANSLDAHGTYVTGVLGGNPFTLPNHQGHAPLVDLMIYKVSPAIPGTFEGFFRDALLRAAAENPHLVNISLSTPGGYIQIVGELDNFVLNNRITTVVAAGNFAELIHSFAEAKNVITVGAVNTGNFGEGVFPDAGCIESNWPPGQVSCFSSFGPVDSDGDGITRIKLDLVAPGMQIPVPAVASGPIYDYDRLSGTSLAAPAVTGVIASMLDWYGNYYSPWMLEAPEYIKAKLIATSLDIGGPEQRHLYGYGVPNATNTIYQEQVRSIWTAYQLTATSIGPLDSKWTFQVAEDFYHTRVVLTWTDPNPIITINGEDIILNELSHRYNLGVFPNSSCTGTPVAWFNTTDGSSDTNLIVIDLMGVPEGVSIPPGGDTWCARITGNITSLPRYLGLAVFSAAIPPQLTVNTSLTTPLPIPKNSLFIVQTTVTNSGIPAGGAYVQLSVPPFFMLEEARIMTRDGRQQTYSAHPIHDSELYMTGDIWSGYTYYLALGQIPYERTVEWEIRSGNVDEGQYFIASTAGFLLQGEHVPAENGSNVGFCVGNTGQDCLIYLPLIIRGGTP